MNFRIALGLILGLFFLAMFIHVLGPAVMGSSPSLPGATVAGEALWKGRTFEVILQGFMILSGVMSILLLIGSRQFRERMP